MDDKSTNHYRLQQARLHENFVLQIGPLPQFHPPYSTLSPKFDKVLKG